VPIELLLLEYFVKYVDYCLVVTSFIYRAIGNITTGPSSG